MLTAFRVRNLRCFEDSGFLDVRPIVVFVGRNSSGKSTLLRLFPLMKQSVSEDTREPILWYGRSADFGSFNEAVRRPSSEEPITFEFRFSFPPGTGQDYYYVGPDERGYFGGATGPRIFASESEVTAEIALAVRPRVKSEGTYTYSVEIRIGPDRLILEANEEGNLSPPRFNGKAIGNLVPSQFRFGRGRFFPNVIPSPSAEAFPDEARRAIAMQAQEGPYFSALMQRLQPFFHGNIGRESLRRRTLRIAFAPATEFAGYFKALSTSSKWKLKADLVESPFSSDLEELRALTLLRHVPRLLSEASSQLGDVGKAVRYLEPVRARAARYYRYQELAIDEIDPQGENVPMFLQTINYSEQRSLAAWMTSALGFEVHATRDGGHVKLVVREKESDREFNLADTGFGYSQVLPIILQLWKLERDTAARPARRRSIQRIVAVEQPELHLHPHFQALLADVFTMSVSAAKKTSSALSLIVETHSEHLVNRLGALVERGQLSKADVVVYLVDRTSPDKAATVLTAEFSETGTLSEPWPFGFFSPQL